MILKRVTPEPLRLPQPGHERRDEKRYRLAECGNLWYRGRPFTCTVINISASGALIEVGVAPAVGQKVVLNGVHWGLFEAEIVHGSEDRLGIKFTADDMAAQGAALDAKLNGRPITL